LSTLLVDFYSNSSTVTATQTSFICDKARLSHTDFFPDVFIAMNNLAESPLPRRCAAAWLRGRIATAVSTMITMILTER
jgi:hypothetical protein